MGPQQSKPYLGGNIGNAKVDEAPKLVPIESETYTRNKAGQWIKNGQVVDPPHCINSYNYDPNWFSMQRKFKADGTMSDCHYSKQIGGARI